MNCDELCIFRDLPPIERVDVEDEDFDDFEIVKIDNR